MPLDYTAPETFFQRQRRTYGPVQNGTAQQTSPTGGGAATAQNGGYTSGDMNGSAHTVAPAANGATTSSQQSSGSTATMATPVTGNGKIPDPQPTPQPQAQAVAKSEPTSPDPFASLGGGVWTGQQWVPQGHPLAIAAQGGTTGTGTGTTGGANPGTVSGAVQGQTALFNVATPVAALPPSYGGTDFSQYQGPNHDAANQQQLDLVQRILGNAQTQSPEIIRQQQQRSAEEQLRLAQQVRQQNADLSAGRGFNPAGGSTDAANRLTNENLMSNIIGQNRDIEINAAQQNRADELAALQASEGVLAGQTNRSGSIYDRILQGQLAQSGDDRAVSQDSISRGLSQFGADLQGATFNLGQQQANRGDYWTGQQLGLQRELGQGGLDIDRGRLGEQGREFDMNNALNVLQLLEGQRQANNNLGFNYNQLNSNNNNSLMGYLMSLIGGG